MTIIKDAMGEPYNITLKTGEIVTVPIRGKISVSDSAITDTILKARDNGLISLEFPIKEQKFTKNKSIKNKMEE